jgi:UrcA family protein
MIKTAIRTALAALALTAAPAAFAADTALHFGDLDLTTAEGRATLDSRIDDAARSVCTVAPRTGSMLPTLPSKECLADARSAIAKQVDQKLAANGMATTEHFARK